MVTAKSFAQFGTLCMLVIALVSNYSIKVMVQSKAAIIANGGVRLSLSLSLKFFFSLLC